MSIASGPDRFWQSPRSLTWLAPGLLVSAIGAGLIARRDRLVLLIAPIMIFVRTLALSLGMLNGALRFHVFRFEPPA